MRWSSVGRSECAAERQRQSDAGRARGRQRWLSEQKQRLDVKLSGGSKYTVFAVHRE